MQQPLTPSTRQPSPATNTQEVQREARLHNLIAERDVLPKRIAEKEREEARLRDSLGAYQSRISSIPARETELVELTRDYETLRLGYTSAFFQEREREDVGEPRAPSDWRAVPGARAGPHAGTAHHPQSAAINAMGAFGGLALGLGLVLFLEYRDRSLRTEADVRSALRPLPVLAVIRRMGVERA